MAIQINDLQPKNFPIELTVNGEVITVQCKPLRLSQALMVSKIGNIFQSVETATKDELVQAETDMNEVIKQAIPELAEIDLDMALTMQIIQGMMNSITPGEQAELNANGVSFDTNPKAEKIG
jgi:hypothetical protein